jgi:hypothetical protein
MPIILAADPPDPLYRIGQAPDPLAWPPRAFTGGGRFDHPSGEYLVLYAAEQRRGAFIETLDSFRPAITDLAAAQQLPAGDPSDVTPSAGIIPDAYFRKVIARLRLASGQSWLNLRAPQTHQVLRTELASSLADLGYPKRFVWGDLLSHEHRLTQAVGQWAYNRGHHGIAYSSCHDARLDCWALFDRALFTSAGPSEMISMSDPDLVAVATLFDLTIPSL